MKKLLYLLCLLMIIGGTSACNDALTPEMEHPDGYGWWSWPGAPGTPDPNAPYEP